MRGFRRHDKPGRMSSELHFPRIQFIFTAHSPLLVMGLRNVFGDDGFQVRELPHGNPIETEEFSEFNHALAYLAHEPVYK
jgi:hypothetical protein